MGTLLTHALETVKKLYENFKHLTMVHEYFKDHVALLDNIF